MASSYDRSTQSLHCKACGKSLAVRRTSTHDPFRMLLLAEAFAIKHLECVARNERPAKRWARFFDRQPAADFPRPLGADYGHGIAVV